MARFYDLEVERDLFGRHVLVRRWGRIGTAGKTRLDEHTGEGGSLGRFREAPDGQEAEGLQGHRLAVAKRKFASGIGRL